MVLPVAVIEHQSSLFKQFTEPAFDPTHLADNTFEKPLPVSSLWTDAEVHERACLFIARTENLVDQVQPSQPDADLDEPEQSSQIRTNLSLPEKALILRSVFRFELASDASDIEALDFLGMALYYRKRLQHVDVDADEKRELIKRIYTAEEPKWTADEIVGLHFILLDSCRSLARSSTNLEVREDLIRWIFTEAWHDENAFSFKHCCSLWGLEQPGLGQLHERVREEMAEMLRGWSKEALRKKEQVLRNRIDKTGQGDFFLS